MNTPPSTTVLLESSPEKIGKSIEIDDVMLEAESALLMAEEVLAVPIEESTKPADKRRQPSSSSSSLEEAKNAISSTMGGVVLGCFLGLVASLEIPELKDGFSSPILPPLLFGIVVGTLGLVGGLTKNELVRNLLGKPMEAIVSALLNVIRSTLQALGLAAQQQVQKTTLEIQALPGKVVDSAARKTKETVEDIASIPAKIKANAGLRIKTSVENVVEDVKLAPRRTISLVKQRGNDIKTSVENVVEEVTTAPRRTISLMGLEKGSDPENNLALIFIPTLLALGIVLVAALPMLSQ